SVAAFHSLDRNPLPTARFCCRQPFTISLIILIGGCSPVRSIVPSSAKLIRDIFRLLLRRFPAATSNANAISYYPRSLLLSATEPERVMSSSERHRNAFSRE